MGLLDTIREQILTDPRVASAKTGSLLISNIWLCTCTFARAGRAFSRDLVVVNLAEGTGTCWVCEEQPDLRNRLSRLVNIDVLDVGRDCPLPLRVAATDSLASVCPADPDRRLVLSGSYLDKMKAYGELIVGESGAELDSEVVVVGLQDEIVDALLSRTGKIRITDLEPSLVGGQYRGIEVANGYARTIEYVERCDIAIVTGMTIVSNTLEDIIAAATAHKTRLVFYSESGGHLAARYIDHGVDVVVSSVFPFYDFHSMCVVNVFTRKETDQQS